MRAGCREEPAGLEAKAGSGTDRQATTHRAAPRAQTARERSAGRAGVSESPHPDADELLDLASLAPFAAASSAEPAKMRRVAQDCDPKAYMYTSSGRKDARIGHFSRASRVAANDAKPPQAQPHPATPAT